MTPSWGYNRCTGGYQIPCTHGMAGSAIFGVVYQISSCLKVNICQEPKRETASLAACPV